MEGGVIGRTSQERRIFVVMWGNQKKFKNTKTTTLIGHDTELYGDMRFSGGLHVDGSISGNVIADEDSPSVLTLSEHGTIQGEVKVPNVVIYGTVVGNVYARNHIELLPSARITGNVHYALIEMAMGAEVNGNLVHNGGEREDKDEEEPLKLFHDPYLSEDSA